MNLALQERERVRLRRVAHEYESKGYKVIIEPKSSELPAFLTRFQPDLIAINSEEGVVVEVKSKDSLSNAESLEALALAIENNKGWRFELVVTNPREGEISSEALELLPVQDLKANLDQARVLGKGTLKIDIALILVWFVIEGTCLHIARGAKLKIGNHGPKQLAKEMLALGVITSEEFSLLEEIADKRNRIVHGFASGNISDILFESACKIASQLLIGLDKDS